MPRNGDRIDGEFLGYRIEEPLGRGGMGVVYRAHDVRLRRTVALKLIAPEFAADERFRERFSRESELAMSLEHPNVVPIHDAGEVDGRLYLVMRRVEGTDLRALLRREGALEPARALAIVRQVGNALDAAHARGLVHRDVKPSNVLLDENEHAYLADFGLTRRFAEGMTSVDAPSLGTPAYLAPEQIEGRSVDGRADVYSLGCLLYESLAGAPPFDAPSRLAVAWAHLEEEPPRISARDRRLPEAFDDVIPKAMAKKPDERYATCGELVAAAEEALGLARPARWRRRAMLLAAALVAIAAAAGALIARAGDEATAPIAARPNTLIKIDPRTNTVAAVVDVGKFPSGVAAAGDSVWVHNLADRTVSEIDGRTNDVVQVAKLTTAPRDAGPGTGSALVADADGAWVIGDRDDGSWALTRVLSRSGRTREHRLNAELVAVAVERSALWILAREHESDVVIQVDAQSGAVTRRTRMPDGLTGAAVSAAERRATSGRLDGLAVGGGFVWVSASEAGTLYRIDPRTGRVELRDLGQVTLRPVFGFGRVWMCVDGKMKTIDPKTLRESRVGTGLAGEHEYVPGYGSMWRYDHASGTLMRFNPWTGDLAALTSVRQLDRDGVTSLATGAGAVWLTVARYY